PTTPPPSSIYHLSLHDALPICDQDLRGHQPHSEIDYCPPDSGGVMAALHGGRRTPPFWGGLLSCMTLSRSRGHVFQHHEHLYRKDRKSTRLNSSHVKISYAVFC